MTRSPASDNTRAWHFLVLRSQNFRSLRPEKAWRPIVTIDVEEHHSHEIVLGVDGQNPNLKQPLLLDEVHEGSRVEFKVWHKSQSHKARNRRKRHLVASASSSLGEIVKRQGDEPHLEIRLSTTTNQTRKNGSSKQKPHACLLVRLRAPSSSLRAHASDYDDHVDGRYSDGAMSDDAPTSSVATPTTAHSEERPPWDQSTDQSTLVDDQPAKLRRRRPKPKGYCLDSDDEAATEYSFTDDDCERGGLRRQQRQTPRP
ncbi:hypothetical protein EVG20_g11437 [Dentipellis fragilis]|uniref:Uncharacterized protein n=1 Tax=Dentipellis fragilis TaxID=205917 RepID=A0A4Y9XMM6_9AGAM|nr:hypothetical protein EVG20_g11437 [Dentipellis fragilis]